MQPRQIPFESTRIRKASLEIENEADQMANASVCLVAASVHDKLLPQVSGRHAVARHFDLNGDREVGQDEVDPARSASLHGSVIFRSHVVEEQSQHRAKKVLVVVFVRQD